MAANPFNSVASSPALLFYDAINNNNIEQLKSIVEVRKHNHMDLCPVHIVAYKGYYSILQYLIQSGVEVNQSTATLQRKPLHFAAMSHQLSCSQLLINAGGLIDAKDTFGNTAMHYAAEDGENSLMTLLLQNGANADSQDITHKTPLMKATRRGRIGAVKRLLAIGCHVNLKDKNDDTALHYSARQGSVEIILMLLKFEARIDAQNHWGLTPLMEAVTYNRPTIVQILIKHNCDLYKRDYRTGDTALHVAVRKNDLHLVEALLRAGRWYLEYNFNNYGESFVYEAVVYNRWELVKLFFEHNYNFDYPAKKLPSGSEKAPFQLVLERGHLELARILSRVYCYYSKNTMKKNDFRELEEVKTLKQWCRKVIRKQICFHFDEKLKAINLPQALIDFIQLDDVEWGPKYFVK